MGETSASHPSCPKNPVSTCPELSIISPFKESNAVGIPGTQYQFLLSLVGWSPGYYFCDSGEEILFSINYGWSAYSNII